MLQLTPSRPSSPSSAFGVYRAPQTDLALIPRTWINDDRLGSLDFMVLIRTLALLPGQRARFDVLAPGVPERGVVDALRRLVRLGYFRVGTQGFELIENLLPSRTPEATPESFWGRTALYRFFDGEHRLLYVGISKQPETRFEQHRKNSVFTYFAEGEPEVEWHPTRRVALAAEIAAIGNERPIFNASRTSSTSTRRSTSASTTSRPPSGSNAPKSG